MYLAKFFHRPPGDDDRELLLIPGSDPMVIGIRMYDSAGSKHSYEDGDFFREEFSGIADAVAAYHRQVEQLAAAGYVETTHTRYTLRDLLPDPQAKPAWQKDLDELMLAALSAPLKKQVKQIAKLENTEAAREPLYLWLAAHRAYAAGDDNAETIRLAEAARDTLASRKAGKTPHYAWSIGERDLEARIFEVLSEARLRAGEPAAALDAIEQAERAEASQDRGALRATILCDHFPERQEEAFDAAFKYADFGGYENITGLPAYAEYLARRKRKSKSDKGWRWSAKRPSKRPELDGAEARLAAKLPADYGIFLGKSGSCELQIRLPDHSGELRFFAPSELGEQRENLFNFIGRTEEDSDEVAAYFREQYGVCVHHLVPIAEPAQESRCVVIHLEPGDRFGWCFHWDHDDAWELEQATPSFDAALKAITDGIERRDSATLSFLGIYLD